MKNYKLFNLIVVFALFFLVSRCKDDIKPVVNPVKSITVSLNKMDFYPGEAITVAVKTDTGKDVTGDSKILMDNENMTKPYKVPTKEGSFKIKAIYKGFKSEVAITVKDDIKPVVNTVKSITVSLNKINFSPGEAITITVKTDTGKDVTGDSKILMDNKDMTKPYKVPTKEGSFKIKATYKKLTSNLLSFSVFVQITPPPNLKDYYANVNFSLKGTNLFDNLATETIAKHTNILKYGDRHKYLYNVDQDPANPVDVILMYSGESRDKREYTSGKNPHHPQTFNTEHVFPQSFIINTAKGDLHHLRVCDARINSSRGNKPFGEGSGTYKNLGSHWYPGDQWKGDVARMVFYLNLRYNESLDEVGSLKLFLQWNAQDPVSAFEIQRNKLISKIQGDRNPFIDNPYLATLIWGGTKAENKWKP